MLTILRSRLVKVCAQGTHAATFCAYMQLAEVSDPAEVFGPAAGLSDILGDNFARGHAQASGGSVSAEAFKRLLKTLGFDENGNTLGGGDKKRKQVGGDADNGTPGKLSLIHI